MNKEYIQILRDKLLTKVEQLKTLDDERLYHNALMQLFNDLIQNNPIFADIIDDLIINYPDYEQVAYKIYNSSDSSIISQNFNKEIEQAAMAYYLLKICVKYPDIKEAEIGYHHRLKSFNKEKEGLAFFTSDIVQPFYQYLDEQLIKKQQQAENLQEENQKLRQQLKIKEKNEWVTKELSKWQRTGILLLPVALIITSSLILIFIFPNWEYNYPHIWITSLNKNQGNIESNITAALILLIPQYIISKQCWVRILSPTSIKKQKLELEQTWESQN